MFWINSFIWLIPVEVGWKFNEKEIHYIGSNLYTDKFSNGQQKRATD